MQALRDAAALAGLLLLALTVRVHLNGAPVELDLATPAEAATEAGLPATRLTLVEPLAPQPAAGPDAPAAEFAPGVRAFAGALAPAQAGLRVEQRTFVWTVGSQRIGIVVHTPEPPPAPCPSAAAADPGHSC